MHELSIAQSLIEAACEAATEERASRVLRLNLRIGALSGVVAQALEFSFELAAEGTLCEGARLHIENVPATVQCPVCREAKTLSTINSFCCPACGSPTSEILAGRELEFISLEFDLGEAQEVGAHEAASA